MRDRFREPVTRLGERVGVEDRSDQRRQQPVLVFARVPQTVTQEVHGAPLPGAPEHLAIAALRPACASLMASWTPTKPRATRARRKSVQNASVSASPTSIERISRRPVSWTPWAITSALLTTRPPSRTFSTLASRNRYG